MSSVVFTLCEGDYHLGVVALINSLVNCGYDQQIVVGYKGKLPSWLSQLEQTDEFTYKVGEASVRFVPVNCERHLGYHKPFFALSLLEESPHLDELFYADPDIVMLAPWSFFANWCRLGVTLVEDCNFTRVTTNHPWRRDWMTLGAGCGLALRDTLVPEYPNSGFFGLGKKDSSILEIWARLTLEFEKNGGDTKRFRQVFRHEAVVSDQDLLSAALMYFNGNTSIIDSNAMGFTGYYFILSHAVESPKPWAKSFLRHSIRGEKPTQAAKIWLRNIIKPIAPYSPLVQYVLKLDMTLATAISRVYCR